VTKIWHFHRGARQERLCAVHHAGCAARLLLEQSQRRAFVTRKAANPYRPPPRPRAQYRVFFNFEDDEEDEHEYENLRKLRQLLRTVA
jgi:hypothetical protein